MCKGTQIFLETTNLLLIAFLIFSKDYKNRSIMKIEKLTKSGLSLANVRVLLQVIRAFQLIRTNAPKQPMALFSTRPEMCAQMRKSPSLSEKCSDLGRRYTKHASRQGREYTKRLSERTMLTGSRLQQNYMPSSLQPKLRHSPYECQRKAGVSR